ncbi:hypothetical protein PIB30_001188 [Stylosanthes scabra]|uniref:Uncharacterized protein n=1 Tax=Stylosanthes scabra TaxID=79078 RepID=A0ABU6V316_9FABA|nr:hypothetical protein [Stylosanthes scabra]
MPLHHIMRPSFSTVDPTLPYTWDHPTRPSTTIATVTDDHHSFAFSPLLPSSENDTLAGPHSTTWPRRHRLTYTCPYALRRQLAPPRVPVAPLPFPMCLGSLIQNPQTNENQNLCPSDIQLSVTQLLPPSPPTRRRVLSPELNLTRWKPRV